MYGGGAAGTLGVTACAATGEVAISAGDATELAGAAGSAGVATNSAVFCGVFGWVPGLLTAVFMPRQ